MKTIILLSIISCLWGLAVNPLAKIQITAKPGQQFTITWQVLIPDYTGMNNNIFARYLGDSDLPQNGKNNPESLPPIGGDLPFKSKSGNVYTFEKTFTAYNYEAMFHPRFVVSTKNDNMNHGNSVVGEVDITCSDGVYCNGIERYVQNKCVSPSALPCQIKNKDGSLNICLSYPCNENLKRCDPVPLAGIKGQGGICDKCAAVPCTPNCGKSGAVCGDDGCGGSCGTCGLGTNGNQLFCIDGACSQVNALGSCANPEPLFGTTTLVPEAGIPLGTYRVLGDNSNGLDMAQLECQSPGIKEWVYKFTVPSSAVNGMGFEIRVTGNDGTYWGTNSYDSVLAIHNADCLPYKGTAVDRLCSDDQTPPGNLASRVDGKLYPGDYTLIVSGYSNAALGPFILMIKFTPGCNPKCEGKFCGDDDCGGICGACVGTDVCTLGRCGPSSNGVCVPDCKGRQCGSDGCGGVCGVCKDKKICNDFEGFCVPVKACNSFFPDCPNNRQGKGPKDAFCGTDCQWHRTDELMPDLVPNIESEVNPTVRFKWADFAPSSCAIVEGCVSGSGRRLLMTFDTRVHNVGTTGFVGPSISKNPDLFQWGSCHQHYHFQKFARFSLLSYDGLKVEQPGAKLSYCMEDVEQYLQGPDILCDPKFDCMNQGIPRGRTDNYPGSLDCQWLDITDLYHAEKLGCWYTYEVCTNIGRTIFEMTYDNNCARFKIYIPQIPNSDDVFTLDYFINRDNPSSFKDSQTHCKP